MQNIETTTIVVAANLAVLAGDAFDLIVTVIAQIAGA